VETKQCSSYIKVLYAQCLFFDFQTMKPKNWIFVMQKSKPGMFILLKKGVENKYPFYFLNNFVNGLQDRIYWSDWEYGIVETANKTTGNNRSVISRGLPRITDIMVFHSRRQGDVNKCSFRNGGCAHLCLPLPGNTYTCQCPLHHTLASDNKSCNGKFYSYFQSVHCGYHQNRGQDSLEPILAALGAGLEINSSKHRLNRPSF